MVDKIEYVLGCDWGNASSTTVRVQPTSTLDIYTNFNYHTGDLLSDFRLYSFSKEKINKFVKLYEEDKTIDQFSCRRHKSLVDQYAKCI